MSNENKEATSRSSVVITGVVPANGKWPISHYGESFYLVQCTGNLVIRTNETSPKPYRKGTGERFVDYRFDRLEMVNETSVDIYFQIWIGFGAYIDTTAEIVEGYTQVFGNATSSLAPVTTLTLSGSPSGVQVQRKAIVVSNLSNSDNLYIKDSSNNFVAAVFPLTTIMLPISGSVKVVNSTAGTIAVCISEIWYTYTA